MKQAWPPTSKEVKTSMLILAGSIVMMAMVGFARKSSDAHEIDPLSVSLFGVFGGSLLWLFLHAFVFLPLKFVPYVTARADRRGAVAGCPRTGAILVRGGLWVYTLTFVALQIAGVAEDDGKNLLIRAIAAIVFLWLIYGVAMGIKASRDFVAYLLVLSAFYLYRLPSLIDGGPYELLVLFQISLGFVLALVLLFSKDAASYLTRQYEKILERHRKKMKSKNA